MTEPWDPLSIDKVLSFCKSSGRAYVRCSTANNQFSFHMGGVVYKISSVFYQREKKAKHSDLNWYP